MDRIRQIQLQLYREKDESYMKFAKGWTTGRRIFQLAEIKRKKTARREIIDLSIGAPPNIPPAPHIMRHCRAAASRPTMYAISDRRDAGGGRRMISNPVWGGAGPQIEICSCYPGGLAPLAHPSATREMWCLCRTLLSCIW